LTSNALSLLIYYNVSFFHFIYTKITAYSVTDSESYINTTYIKVAIELSTLYEPLHVFSKNNTNFRALELKIFLQNSNPPAFPSR
jgi:hypothetical protein